MAFNPNALSDAEYLEAQRKYAAPNYDAVAEAIAYAQARADQERASRPARKSGRKASSQPASPVADMALGGIVADAMQKAAEQSQIEKRGINEDVPLRPSHTQYIPLKPSHATFDDTPANFLDYINNSSEYAPALQAIEEGIDTAPVGALGGPLNALAKSPIAKSVLERISNLFNGRKAEKAWSRMMNDNSLQRHVDNVANKRFRKELWEDAFDPAKMKERLARLNERNVPQAPPAANPPISKDAVRSALHSRDLVQQGVSVSPKSGGLPPYVNKNTRDLFFDILGFGI